MTDSTPVAPPAASPAPSVAAPEPSVVAEETPPVPSQVLETPGTAIPIPSPQGRAPISTPTPEPTVIPEPNSATVFEESTSPRTLPAEPLPAEPTIVPSIERDVEQAVVSEVARAASRRISDVGPLNEGLPVVEAAAPTPRASPSIKLTGAKKTSEITKPKAQPRPRAPQPTPPATQPTASAASRTSETPTASVPPSVALSTPEPSQLSAKVKKRKASKAGTADSDGKPRPKKVRRRREITPDDAEGVEILPNVIKMSELCKDLKTGRKSKRELELRRLEMEEQERKHLEQQNGTPAEPPSKSDTARASKEAEDRLEENSDPSGPVMRIVNGEIVLDASSLQVDRHADALRDAGEMTTVEENQLTRKINQSTYGKRSKTEAWDEDMTELFYMGLRIFGTDFQCISKMFPGRSRRQIKLKFNNEERKNPSRITETMQGERQHIDLATCEALTHSKYEDPKDIQRELDADKEAHLQQQEKEKQLQEEMLRNPTGSGDGEATSNEKSNAGPAKVKKRNSKKQNMNMAGGQEEVLGSIDD